MAALALAIGIIAVVVGSLTDNAALLILGWWIVLIGFGCLLAGPARTNAEATGRPLRSEHAARYWDLAAWPTAAPGSYPEEEM